MDEATLFKFGKWIDYGKSHPKGKNFPPKGAWSGSCDSFCNFKTPDQYFGMDEATLFNFRKCIDYGECHTRG